MYFPWLPYSLLYAELLPARLYVLLFLHMTPPNPPLGCTFPPGRAAFLPNILSSALLYL